MSQEPEDGMEQMPAEGPDIEQAFRRAQKNLVDGVYQHLENRYGRPFRICRAISDPGAPRIRMIVRTQDEPLVCFTVELDGDTGEIRDNYVGTLCLNELKAALEEDLPGTAVSATLLEGIVPETDAGLTLAAYLRKHGDRRILAHIIAPADAYPERSAVISAVQRAHGAFDAEIAVYCYALEGESFRACRRQLEAYPSLTGAMVREHRPVREFSFLAGDGGIRVSEVK